MIRGIFIFIVCFYFNSVKALTVDESLTYEQQKNKIISNLKNKLNTKNLRKDKVKRKKKKVSTFVFDKIVLHKLNALVQMSENLKLNSVNSQLESYRSSLERSVENTKKQRKRKYVEYHEKLKEFNRKDLEKDNKSDTQ